MSSSSRAAVVGFVLIALAVWTSVASGADATGSRAEAQTAPGPDRSGPEMWAQDCAICHGVRGQGSFQGPAIDQSGTAAVDFMVRTGRMPAPLPSSAATGFGPDSPDADRGRHAPRYSDAEIAALVDHTASFVVGPEATDPPDLAGADLVRGGELYRLNCAACHQMAGAGGALAYGTVGPELDSSSPLDVVEAMRTGPGSMPVFDASTFDENEATDVAAYVAYLRDPEDRGGSALWHLGPVPEGLVAWVFGIGAVVLFCRWLGTRQRLSTE